jgi:hypothetical protein
MAVGASHTRDGFVVAMAMAPSTVRQAEAVRTAVPGLWSLWLYECSFA